MASASHPEDAHPGAALLRSLKQHRERILSRIRDANGTTEREVLAVGEELRLIVNEARTYVADSRKTLEKLAGASPTALLAQHGTKIQSFVCTMQAHVSAQSEAAKLATDQINRIVELGRAIQRVTMESKVLALNANIQARRLGAAGESFLVIAQEMKQFSESVDGANKGVEELARGLLEVLPRIGSVAADMREASEEFSTDITERVTRVASTNSEMKQQVANSMASGETRLQQILRHSYDALSHLQFQDPVAQDLLECDKDLEVCLRLAESWLAGGNDPVEESEAECDRSADSSLDAGEVMLF